MKFITATFTTLCALAPLAASAPTRSTEDISSSSSLLTRDQNTCSPTGPESCNLWIRTTIYPSDDGSEPMAQDWAAYDSGCNDIGGGFDVPMGVEVQLQPALDGPINVKTAVDKNLGGDMFYKGRHTDLGAAHCKKCQPVDGGLWANCCRVAFRCN